MFGKGGSLYYFEYFVDRLKMKKQPTLFFMVALSAPCSVYKNARSTDRASFTMGSFDGKNLTFI